jgi:cell division protein FtsW
MTTTTGPRPAAAKEPAAPPAAGNVTALWSKIENPPMLWRPLASYYLLLASTALLVGFGIVMVWSSSYVESDQVSFAVLQKQLLWLAIGVPLMLIASRLPVSFFRALAYPALIASCGLLVAVLVPGLGVSANGATRWVSFGGPFTIQPSEFAKLGLVLWGADLLARKYKLRTLDTYRRILIPLLPVSLVVLLLIDKEHDLGTMLVVLTIVLSLLWVVGAPMRLFGITLVAVAGGVSYLAISEPYRLQRLLSFDHPFKDCLNTGWQACQAAADRSGATFPRRTPTSSSRSSVKSSVWSERSLS